MWINVLLQKYNKGDIINKHYNECYLIIKSIDISNIKIQKEEVSEVRYFSKNELLKRIFK